MVRKTVLFLAFAAVVSFAQTEPHRHTYAQMVHFYDYDALAPLDVKELSSQARSGVLIHDVTYVSPRGGVVPAYVVEPERSLASSRPAILWGHWMMPGSPLKNRREFLDEAILLARAGAVSLLIDTPQVRPNGIDDSDPTNGSSSRASQQQVIDFRRGIDLLLADYRVDPRRIAYVGHSFDAHVGAILIAVEKRISAAVLMAGGFADEEYVMYPTITAMKQMREKYGDAKLRQVLAEYDWDDPVYYLPHSSPASVFLQFGNKDAGGLNGKRAEHYYDMFGKPKKIKFYDAGHALNAAARKDRVAFLVDKLKLRPVSDKDLETIPQLQ